MSMSFHHFTDPRAAARECRRVLREGAPAVLRTGVRERIPAYPYVEFFPTSRSIMDDVLPAVADIREVFEAAGFRAARSEIVTQQIAPDLATYTEKLAAGADSVLAQLSEKDFKAGIAALRAHAARAGDHAVTEPIDVLVFR
jgi:ubiquinone/menaquinone biosynthesis C-methylase UbiE